MRAEWGKGGQKFVRLLGRVHVETREEFRRSFMEHFTTVFSRFTDGASKSATRTSVRMKWTWRAHLVSGRLRWPTR